MKKFSFIAFIAFIAFMAVLVSTLGFAQDAPKPAGPEFKFSGAAYAYTARMNTTVKDSNSDYSAFRFRPYFTMKSENIEAAVKFEIDSVMGKSATVGGKGVPASDVGYDESAFSEDGDKKDKGTIEVKSAYLKMNVPAVSGLWIKGGSDNFTSVGKFMINTEIAGGSLGYKAGMFDVVLLNGKVVEGAVEELKDDVDFYAADAKIKLSDTITVNPALYVLQYAENAGDANGYVPALGLNAKFGAFGIDAAFNYGMMSGFKSGTKEIDYAGYAFDVAPSFKLNDSLSFTGFFTMVSGDDGKQDSATADEETGFQKFILKADSGRLFILEDMAEFTNIGNSNHSDIRTNKYGYMIAGLSAKYDMKPFTFYVAGAWAQTAAEQDGNDDFESALGTEIDAALMYEIEKNAVVRLELGYLMAGDAWKTGTESPENASNLALGLMYKW